MKDETIYYHQWSMFVRSVGSAVLFLFVLLAASVSIGFDGKVQATDSSDDQSTHATIIGQVIIKDEGPAPVGIVVVAKHVGGDEVRKTKTISDSVYGSGWYQLDVFSGTWEIAAQPDLYMPYVSIGPETISVRATQTVTQHLFLERQTTEKHSHITGVLKGRDGNVITGVKAKVWAISNRWQWASTQVDEKTGSYDLVLPVGKQDSTWWVQASVYRNKSNYVVLPPRIKSVTIKNNDGNGDTVKQDFVIVALHNTIKGQILAPDGANIKHMPSVPVVARERINRTNPVSVSFTFWTFSKKRDGQYQLNVADGTYQIRSSNDRLGGKLNGNAKNRLIPPAPVEVSVSGGAGATADLHYRWADAVVTGQVLYQPISTTLSKHERGRPAMIYAVSSDKVAVYTKAKEDGQYQLYLKSGLAWTIQAVSRNGKDYLRSEPVTIMVVQSHTQDLLLNQGDTVFDDFTQEIDPSVENIITLPDGTQIVIPAGALATSGNVIIKVAPRCELQPDYRAIPISIRCGYKISAYKVTVYGDELIKTNFKKPVTMIIRFTKKELARLGVRSLYRVCPSHWDATTESWSPIDDAIVNEDDNGGTVSISVDSFAPSSPSSESPDDNNLQQTTIDGLDFAFITEAGVDVDAKSNVVNTVYLPAVSR